MTVLRIRPAAFRDLRYYKKENCMEEFSRLLPSHSRYTVVILSDVMGVQTCYEGGNSPANQVVESHGSIVDVSHFADHAVDVQPLQEEPGESAEVEEVQQDGDDCADKLQRKGGTESGD